MKLKTLDTQLLAEYDNNFENRFLNIEDLTELEKKANSTQVVSSKTELIDEVKLLMKPVREIESIMQQAVQISEGTSTLQSFTFDNKTFKKKQLEEGYNFLMEKREALFNTTFNSWDAKFCVTHIKLANEVNKAKELKALYLQHKTITTVYKAIVDAKKSILIGLNKVQNNSDLTQLELNNFSDEVISKCKSLNNELDRFDSIQFTSLPNIENITELKEAIVAKGIFTIEHSRIFENSGFDRIMQQIENAVNHCQRIDQKSISTILSFHNELRLKAA